MANLHSPSAARQRIVGAGRPHRGVQIAALNYWGLSVKATLWRAVLGRVRIGAAATCSLSCSDGCVSACGVPASPTSSRRNLNLDRKSCQTTYQPGGGNDVSLSEMSQNKHPNAKYTFTPRERENILVSAQ